MGTTGYSALKNGGRPDFERFRRRRTTLQREMLIPFEEGRLWLDGEPDTQWYNRRKKFVREAGETYQQIRGASS